MQRYLLWCGYAGSSLQVKIGTDSNDAVEIKAEADSNDLIWHVISRSGVVISITNCYIRFTLLYFTNDITEYPCDDGPSVNM